MSSVAFLALTYESFNHIPVMQRFFSEETSSLWNLYIHNKYDNVDLYFNPFCIAPSKRINTSWGKYSIVQATSILLEEALKNEANEFFCLISNSHCPLYDIKTTCNFIKNMGSGYTGNLYKDSIYRAWRFDKLFNAGAITDELFPFSKENYGHHWQWFVCDRACAERLVHYEQKYRSWFNKVDQTIADEACFGLFIKTFKIPYNYNQFTYVNWEYPTSLKFREKYNITKNPHTYDCVDQNIINKLRKNGFIFMRKVHKETKIDIDYIFKKYI